MYQPIRSSYSINGSRALCGSSQHKSVYIRRILSDRLCLRAEKNRSGKLQSRHARDNLKKRVAYGFEQIDWLVWCWVGMLSMWESFNCETIVTRIHVCFYCRTCKRCVTWQNCNSGSVTVPYIIINFCRIFHDSAFVDLWFYYMWFIIWYQKTVLTLKEWDLFW